MLVKQIEHLADMLVEKGIAKQEERALISHGFTTGSALCINFATTILLGLLFQLALESFVFLTSFSIIRSFAGGYHCKNAITCYFASSGITVLALAIAIFTPIEWQFEICALMLLLSIPILLKFAPVETPTKPLDAEEKNHYRKKTLRHLTLECALVPLLFLAGLQSFALAVCLGVAVAAGLVLAGLICETKGKLL